VGTHFAPADGRDGRPRAPTPADWNACAPPSAPSAAAVTAATAPHRMVRLDVSFVTLKLQRAIVNGRARHEWRLAVVVDQLQGW